MTKREFDRETKLNWGRRWETAEELGAVRAYRRRMGQPIAGGRRDFLAERAWQAERWSSPDLVEIYGRRPALDKWEARRKLDRRLPLLEVG